MPVGDMKVLLSGESIQVGFQLAIAKQQLDTPGGSIAGEFEVGSFYKLKATCSRHRLGKNY